VDGVANLTDWVDDPILDLMISTVSSLKAHLAENLRRVAGGETVVVTDRRKPVARIVPYELDDLVEATPVGPFRPVRPNLEGYPDIDTLALLVAERGDH
jgi:prevent-host-death family protein